jgi:putative DNA primase/helicase
LQKALQDFVQSLGYSFEINFQKQANVWHGVQTEGFKGSYIFKEIRFQDCLCVWLTVYNYKTSEAHNFKHASRELSEQELKKLDKERKLLDEKLKEEKTRVWNECRIYCEKEFEKHAFTTSHPYFEKKNVQAPPAIFKKRISEVDGSEELLCPMSDAHGRFWGYQIISEPRGKDFNLGQKTEECALFLGIFSHAPRIYLCEGIATGLSIHEATGSHATACALSANNLPKVAKALRKIYPKTPIVILGDNDQWASGGNAGKKYAELCEQECDGVVAVIPDFPKDHPEKPTDFNDWHRIGGLESLSKVLAMIKPVRPEHFWALGHAKGNYFFTNLRAPEIHATKDFSSTDLLKILSLKKWKSLYPEHVSPVNDRLDWEFIKSDLIDQAQKKGQFRIDQCRGLGIYLEQGESLVHLGDRVFYKGAETELQDFESESFYDLKSRKELPERPPGYKLESFSKTLRDILGGYVWENALSPEFIMGWLYCAYASGALSWRPHLLVSARAGSGKSTIASLIVEELLKFSGHVKKEDATEAGVRQEIENNSVPLIHDEFDTNKGEPKRLASVLNLLRAASSGGSISRGTPSGKALRFEARFCAYLTGINPPNLNEADQTRVTVLRLLKPNPRPWSDLEREILKVVDSNAAAAIFWRVVDTLPAMMQSAKTLQKCFAGHGERVGQQYGALLAGFWHLFHVEQITISAATEFVKRVEGAAEANNEKLAVCDNAERCVEKLLDLVIHIKNEGERTLGQILMHEPSDIKNDPFKVELERVGVLRLPGGQIFVAGNHSALDEWFEKSQFQNYREALLRLPGAKNDRKWVGGKNPRGITFPLETQS